MPPLFVSLPRAEIEEVLSEWLTDRTAKDEAEKRLVRFVCDHFPRLVNTKETCTCGEQDECDECFPNVAAVRASHAPLSR